MKKKPCYEFHGEFKEGCGVCLRWRDDPRYAVLRGESTPVPSKPLPGRVPLPCIHRGEQVGETRCPTCSGNVQIKTYACAVHGTCAFDKRAKVKTCDANCVERVAPG